MFPQARAVSSLMLDRFQPCDTRPNHDEYREPEDCIYEAKHQVAQDVIPMVVFSAATYGACKPRSVFESNVNTPHTTHKPRHVRRVQAT
jgi:hypothetical protein